MEKSPPPKCGVGLSFPAFGFRRPDQKGWTGLEQEAPKPPPDLKKKKRPAAFPFEVAGPMPFPRARFHYMCPLPNFLPPILFGPRQLAL
jgi:hypothetical protein